MSGICEFCTIIRVPHTNLHRCPLYENAYASDSMQGRVSRYPFPDHHPPPLPLLPLAVREMSAWLQGDAERIAIIHCKAGKVGYLRSS
jgi:protein-tyrosine phosphatase